MKIIEFDRKKGIYNFELEEIKTVTHSHPAIEILYSDNGGIQMEINNKIYENASFAIIDSNIPHKVNTEQISVQVMMLECSSDFLSKVLDQFAIQLSDGIYVEKQESRKDQLIKELTFLYKKSEVPKTENARIKTCLNYLNSEDSDYTQMINVLSSSLSLSESRLSHLFKEEIGISLKKYLVWSRLKKAFQLVANGGVNMYEAALQSGFYDQAHLSKAFKQMLGLSPSEVYNSRIVQDK